VKFKAVSKRAEDVASFVGICPSLLRAEVALWEGFNKKVFFGKSLRKKL
jgi:hypothetical protein